MANLVELDGSAAIFPPPDLVPTRRGGSIRDEPAAARAILERMMTHDRIEFVISTKVNESHQDPNVPQDLELRRSVVNRMTRAHGRLSRRRIPPPRTCSSARNFARSCGVTEAVMTEATAKIPGFKLNAKQINGIDRKTCTMLRLYASGKLSVNFLEVMSCPGECVNGPCSLC